MHGLSSSSPGVYYEIGLSQYLPLPSSMKPQIQLLAKTNIVVIEFCTGHVTHVFPSSAEGFQLCVA